MSVELFYPTLHKTEYYWETKDTEKIKKSFQKKRLGKHKHQDDGSESQRCSASPLLQFAHSSAGAKR